MNQDELIYMKVWTVMAYRFGNKEKHGYVVGVYNSETIAKYAADIEEAWRGGNKYECEVACFDVSDRPEQKKLGWYKETDPTLFDS